MIDYDRVSLDHINTDVYTTYIHTLSNRFRELFLLSLSHSFFWFRFGLLSSTITILLCIYTFLIYETSASGHFSEKNINNELRRLFSSAPNQCRVCITEK